MAWHIAFVKKTEVDHSINPELKESTQIISVREIQDTDVFVYLCNHVEIMPCYFYSSSKNISNQ